MFEYTADELTGANVDILMPKVFAENHDKWMRRYFDTNREKVMNTERRVFPIVKRGFIFPANLLYKILPEVSSSINIIAIFNQVTSDDASLSTMIVNMETGILLGITASCYTKYGIHPALVYGNPNSSGQLAISQLIPSFTNANINDKSLYQELQCLDVTSLADRFYIERDYKHQLGLMPTNRASKTGRFYVKLDLQRVESYDDNRLMIMCMSINDES